MRTTTKVFIAPAGVAAVVGLALVWKLITSDPSSSTPVGYVSWSTATVQTRSSRIIDVAADVHGRDQKIGCTPTTNPTVE